MYIYIYIHTYYLDRYHIGFVLIDREAGSEGELLMQLGERTKTDKEKDRNIIMIDREASTAST